MSSPSDSRRKSLETARWAIRLVERFVYRELAEGVEDVRSLQRLVVGARRKLENYAVEDSRVAPSSAPEGD